MVGMDPRPLALTRMALGVVAIVALAQRAGTPAEWVVAAVGMLAALALIAGLKPRIAALFTGGAVAFLSTRGSVLDWRAASLWLPVALLALLLVDAGARYSLDAVLMWRRSRARVSPLVLLLLILTVPAVIYGVWAGLVL